jgi:hypothetical protein
MIFSNISSLIFAEKYDKITIIISKDASNLEKYAAKEVRRYIYLRTGLLSIILFNDDISRMNDNLIIITKPGSKLFNSVSKNVKIYNDLTEQEYFLLSYNQKNKRHLLITGGNEIGMLYGAYRFLESMGIRFYLHGDVVPEKKIDFKLPEINERRRPLFSKRGILPFHDFAEGPDFWNLEEYKSIFTQMAKLKMNFIGLHNYMDVPYTAEPAVWVGQAKDVLDNGDVKYSFPASYQNTLRENYIYAPKKTSDFLYGASQLFEDDVYSTEIMKGSCPKPNTPEKCNELFNRTGKFYKEALSFAKKFDIKTCLGTDLPLYIVDSVRERSINGNKNISKREIAKIMYDGVFKRIKKSFPLDYYWLWLPEVWTWSGANDSTINAAKEDVIAAIDAGKNQKIPFQIAMCGWVLGPPNDRAMFDNFLPKEIPVSCINREVGFARIDNNFNSIHNREKWAIPWFEDDAATANPQLWVRRIRRDALDALKYKCDGLIGLHWRTKVLSPNINALAEAAWDESPWNNPPLKLKEEYKLSGPVGGRFTIEYGHKISNSNDDSIYQTQRHDVLSYNFKVPNGKYSVTLKFCELKHDSMNQRVFSVLLQGKNLIKDLDIFAKAGKDCALDFTFDDIEVNNGWLDIDFVKKIDVTTIAGIVIKGDHYSKKINCGGEKYKDFDEDWYIYLPDQTPISSGDFYRDWAINQFGNEVSKELGLIFENIDGRLPRPTDWVDGPGNLKPDSRKWNDVEKEYYFINEMEKLGQKISGRGNIERFEYWLNNFLYMKNLANMNCMLYEFDTVMNSVKTLKDSVLMKKMAETKVLPLRVKIIGQIKKIYNYLLPIVTTPGEIGTLDNMEQHILPGLLKKTGDDLKRILGNLPVEAIPSGEYTGKTRIIVPTVRTAIAKNENLEIRILILSEKPVKKVNLYYRELGTGKFIQINTIHIARGVYSANIDVRNHNNKDFEYYIHAIDADDKGVIYPVTAPEMNQSVICN